MSRITSNDRVHKTEKQYEQMIVSAIERALKAGTITEDDARLIGDYVNAKRGIVAPATLKKNVTYLILLRQYMNNSYRSATRRDLTDAKIKAERATDGDGKHAMTDSTCRCMISCGKAFLRWGMDEDEGEVWCKLTEAQLHKVPVTKTPQKTKTIDDILTADDVRRVIDAANNSRDRAMLALQYECALRAVEICRLRWSDLTQISDQETSIHVCEKTDYPRDISIVLFNAYLAQWKRDSPNASDNDGYVFLTQGNCSRGLQMKYDEVSYVLKTCALRAGVTSRKLTPHTLRHSRITYWLQHDVSIAKICMMAWGTEYSTMIKTYGHLGNDDMAKEQRRLAGIAESDVIQTGTLSLSRCPVCGRQVPPGKADYCAVCGSALNEGAASKLSQRKADKETEMQATIDRLQAQMDEMKALLLAQAKAKN